MKKEIIVTGKTIEEAVEKAAAQLGRDSSDVTYEVIDLPKKGFLGFGEVPAKIKATAEASSECAALDFVRNILADMKLDATADLTGVERSNGDKVINISGKDAGVLIGHHGETLDALQYLVNLAANKREEEGDGYTKYSVDAEDYRAKREETLRRLAQRMAAKVLKYKKSITLEPMNSYERRILHSEVQEIEGVLTTSVGTENNRRIVMYLEGTEPFSGDRKKSRRK